MSGPCCGYSPLVLKDNQWVCSECESLAITTDVEEYKQLDLYGFDNFETETSTGMKKKCDCGASSTSNPNCHSHWCSVK